MGQTTIRTTCPRDCYDACGILVTLRRRGDHARPRRPDHPVSRGQAVPQVHARLQRRVPRSAAAADHAASPRSAPRARARFEPITWDDGAREIAERLTRHRRSPRAGRRSSTRTTPAPARCSATASRCGSSTGWARPRSIPTRSATRPATSRWTTCTASVDGFDPRTRRRRRLHPGLGREPLGVGAAPARALAGRGAGHGDRGRPDRAPRRPRAADLHLQPFPGSDAALAFALLHVLAPRRHGRPDFLAAHTVGWDELEPLLADCTPAWGERDDRRAGGGHRAGGAARTAPGRRCCGSARACSASRPAATSMRAVRAAAGGHRQPRASPAPGSCTSTARAARHRRRLPRRRRTCGEPPPPVSHMDLAERLEDPGAGPGADLLEHQHRRLQPEQARLRARARARGPVHRRGRPLPDRHHRSRRRRAAGGQLPGVRRPRASRTSTSACPPRSRRPSRSARRCPTPRSSAAWRPRWASTEPELHEPDAEIIAALLGADGRDRDFASCARWGRCRYSAEPVVQFAELRVSDAERPDRDRLGAPPRPTGIRGCRSRAPTRARPADLLRLLTPASPWMLNDTLRQRPQGHRADRARRTVALHPADARRPRARRRRRGGGCQRRRHAASSTSTCQTACRAGVALSPKGRWPKREAEPAPT